MAILDFVSTSTILWVALAGVILRLITNRFKKGLSDIPGPGLAKYSRLWKLHSVWKGDHHLASIDLHKKYGSLVRIGPNHISVGDPDAIPIIYGFDKGFTKTAFYPLQCIIWQKKPQLNLFSTRDEAFHRQQKRPIASAFSLTSLLELEPLVDSCTALFMSKLRDFADTKKPVDMGAWLQYYAFDVVGEMTFAKKLGFLEEGKDIDGIIEQIGGLLVYASVCGQVPEMHNLLFGNPLLPILLPSMENWSEVTKFTLKAMNSRTSVHDNKLDEDQLENGNDMLSRWLGIHQADSNKMSTRDVIVHLSTNVFAGSDTTAIALRAIIYFLLQNPESMEKVQTELNDGIVDGKISNPVTYRESTSHLPYLGAVIKEAMRLHPSVGMLLEREVPAGGTTISGKHIPGGTIVGINPWVVHHDSEIFSDPTRFLPERWLESSPEHLKKMEKAFFNFGAGSRTCIGKHVSMIEIQKVVPQLLREFEIKLHAPEKEWTTRNVWFVQQADMICDLVRK